MAQTANGEFQTPFSKRRQTPSTIVLSDSRRHFKKDCLMNVFRLPTLLIGCLLFVVPVSATPALSDEKTPSKPAAAPKPARADWAEIKLSGSYSESQQMPGLFGELTESLATCLDRLGQASRDKSIKGVILHIDGVEIGWAKLNELQTAIREVKASGKSVWARMNDASTKDYLLAAVCDKVIVPESATLMLTGVRAEVTFYRNLFDLLDIKADMLRVGAFKSAAEPYTRTEMSPEFRAEMEEMLDDYFGMIVSQISSSRTLTAEQVEAAIDEGMIPAARAKELGLIDDLAYEDQIVSLIQDGNADLDVRLRSDYRKKKPSLELDLFSLMELMSGGGTQTGSTRPRIAVVHAEGAIVSGNSPLSLFGEAGISSDKMVPLITKLGKDDNVKAIVLRVDSPGGSALASDLIWRALEATGKPVIASMGDTAASGGYYISMGADRIYAEPGTLTGSIGVVGGKVSFEGLMNKVGVTQSVISRGKNSGVMSLTTAFTESERIVMQRMLDTIYKQFTEKAAAGRQMDYAKLELMARGRVYTGQRAKALGLVDELGTLADAVAYARTLVGDTDGKLELESLPKPQSPLEMLLGQTERSQPSPAVAASLMKILPESLQPVLRHLTALQQLATEPALTIMPYAISIR